MSQFNPRHLKKHQKEFIRDVVMDNKGNIPHGMQHVLIGKHCMERCYPGWILKEEVVEWAKNKGEKHFAKL